MLTRAVYTGHLLFARVEICLRFFVACLYTLSMASPETRQARRKLGMRGRLGKPAPSFRGRASPTCRVGRRPKTRQETSDADSHSSGRRSRDGPPRVTCPLGTGGDAGDWGGLGWPGGPPAGPRAHA